MSSMTCDLFSIVFWLLLYNIIYTYNRGCILFMKWGFNYGISKEIIDAYVAINNSILER